MSQTLLERCSLLAASAAGNPTHYMVEQGLAQAELDWRFLTFEVEEADLTKALEGLDVLGFRGVLLAPELRTAAIERLETITPRARRAGSVNCLVRDEGGLVGDNTFGEAFVEAVGGGGLAERGLLVIGDGRVAANIAAAAGDAGASHVHLASADDGSVAELIEHLSDGATEYGALGMADNTVRTPEGVSIVVFAPDNDDEVSRPVIDTSLVEGMLTMVDTRLRGSRTGLLKFANEQGATIIDGVDLLARETALALELWTGMTFDRAPLQELAEEFLGV